MYLELIRKETMAEDVDEEQPRFRFEPFRDFFKKLFIVFHVFKHFVSHNTIELVIKFGDIDISGNALNCKFNFRC